MGYGSEILAMQLNMGASYMKLRDSIWMRHGLQDQSKAENFWPYVLKHLSRGEQALLLSSEFFVWFSEGGFDSFFFEGDNYRRAHETVQALRDLGLDHAAEFLKRAIGAVGIPNPVPADYEYVPPESPEPALEQVERDYRRVRREESLEIKTVEYLRKHSEEFA
jgi:hypothetical protein